MAIHFCGNFAVLDSGSLYVKGLIVHYEDKEPLDFEVTDRFEGSVEPRPGEDKLEAYKRVWGEFKKFLDKFPHTIKEVIHVGTATMRNQSNGTLSSNDYVQASEYIDERLKVQIISAEQEAKTAHKAISYGLQEADLGETLVQTNESYVTIDMGGGSTEMVLNNDAVETLCISVGGANTPWGVINRNHIPTITLPQLENLKASFEEFLTQKSSTITQVKQHQPQYLIMGKIPSSFSGLLTMHKSVPERNIQVFQTIPNTKSEPILIIEKEAISRWLMPDKLNQMLKDIYQYSLKIEKPPSVGRFPIYLVLYNLIMEKLDIPKLVIGNLGTLKDGLVLQYLEKKATEVQAA